ncbi:MAG TPA: CPBP family intramembrane glutamic endopeptidase [Planctomycetota bacterium]|nr:CPBP family intramembrane glutamic endopeptidase [Planctomycetota bacterium]
MIFFDDPIQLEEGSRELALAGAALALAGLALTPVCTALARRFSPKAAVFFARWRFLHAALVAAAFVVFSQLSMLLVELAAPGLHLPKELSPIVAGALGFLLTGLLVFALAARLDPDGIRSLGLRASGSLRAAAVGIGCYLVVLPGLIGVSLLWPWLLERLGRDFEIPEIAVQLQSLSGGPRLAGALLAILVFPFFEELLFRGFLQPLFVQNLGDRGGVFLTSLVFALLHGDSAFLPILALAILLGSLKLRTQRLSAPFAVHALHNAIVFLTLGLGDAA